MDEKLQRERKRKNLTRIKLLKKWAIENNMMKPKLERLKAKLGSGLDT